jgi:hypothetical protein
MTYPEVVDEINAFYRRRKAETRDREQLRAKMDYQLAQLIGVMFHEPKKYPKSLSAAYPDLFGDSSGGWQESKAQWQKYAAEFNRQREVRST